MFENVWVAIGAIIIGVILFVWLNWHSYNLGFAKCRDKIFDCKKVIQEQIYDSDELSFVGIVYDFDSPIYRQITEEVNPHNINISGLQKLRDELVSERIDTPERKAYVKGQLDILNSILDIPK